MFSKQTLIPIGDSTNDKIAERLAIGGWGLSGDWQKVKNISTIQENIRTVFAAAYDSGIRMFDTAAVYGQGIVEAVLGTLPFRKDIFISSKIPAKTKPSDVRLPNSAYYDPLYMDEVLGGILARLDLTTLDLIQLHNWAPWWNEEADYFLAPLINMKKQGNVRYIGISLPDLYNADIDPILKTGILDFVQVPYNPYLSWAKEKIFDSPYLGPTRLYVRSIFEQGLITPELATANDISYKQDNRRGRCDLSELRKCTEQWLQEEQMSWDTVQEMVMKKALREAGPNATLLISMTNLQQIQTNLQRIQTL